MSLNAGLFFKTFSTYFILDKDIKDQKYETCRLIKMMCW